MPSVESTIHISEFCRRVCCFAVEEQNHPVPTDAEAIERACSREDVQTAVNRFISKRTGLGMEDVWKYLHRAGTGCIWSQWNRRDPDNPKESIVQPDITAIARRMSDQSDPLMVELLPWFWELYPDVAAKLEMPRPGGGQAGGADGDERRLTVNIEKYVAGDDIHDNQGLNLATRLSVGGSLNQVNEGFSPAAVDALIKLEGLVNGSRNDAARRHLEDLKAESAKQQPDPSRLRKLGGALVQALPTITAIADLVKTVLSPSNPGH